MKEPLTPEEFIDDLCDAVQSMNEEQKYAFHVHGMAMAMVGGAKPREIIPLMDEKLQDTLRFFAEVKAGVNKTAAERRAVLKLVRP